MSHLTDPATWTEGSGLLALLAAAVLLLAVTLYRARRRGHVTGWISAVATIATLGLTSEAMFLVAVERLELPVPLAIVTFAVFELSAIAAGMHAAHHYRRHGWLGRHGTVVWTIAVTAGAIAALNAHSLVEVVLRLALPLLAVWLWSVDLTAEGVTRPAGSWRWTPRRLLVRIGAIEPTERDLSEVTRDRQVRVMTVVARRVHGGAWPRRFHAARLERLALRADDAALAAVREGVTRAHRVRELTAPVAPASVAAPAALDASTPPLAAPARAEARRVPADGPARPQRSTRPASRQSDAALLAEFGDQLTAEATANGGTISRYRVQQVCHVGARPADRIKTEIERRATSATENDDTPQTITTNSASTTENTDQTRISSEFQTDHEPATTAA